MRIFCRLVLSIAATAIFIFPLSAQQPDCSKVPDYNKLKQAVSEVVKQGKQANGGLGNQEWGAVVNRDGLVCAIVFSGQNRTQEWPGSRLIAAEKANTANAFSLPNFALSTGNLYAGAQPGQSLYGIANAPPNPEAAFAAPATKFGESDDPMVGKAVGGVIVFGGGLPLYTPRGELVGGLGLSGDTACADHVIAWKVREKLALDGVPMGVAPRQTDNLIFDIKDGASASGFGHPPCKGGMPAESIIEKLPESNAVGPKR